MQSLLIHGLFFFTHPFTTDDLPIHGVIGFTALDTRNGVEEEHYYLYRHIHFDILYNADQVIYVNVSQDDSKLVDLKATESQHVSFSYSVKWHITSKCTVAVARK
jgi:hypothetical protein